MEKGFRLIGETRRHDVRLTDPSMAVVFEIAIEGGYEWTAPETPSIVAWRPPGSEHMTGDGVFARRLNQLGDAHNLLRTDHSALPLEGVV
jgi:hypothetical protein